MYLLAETIFSIFFFRSLFILGVRAVVSVHILQPYALCFRYTYVFVCTHVCVCLCVCVFVCIEVCVCVQV